MRGLILALTLMLLLPMPRPATAQGDAIETTILQQFEAFKANDFTTAFGFASPTIKGIFGSPENFGAMVAQGYPMVHRPGAVRMLDRVAVAGQMYQRVLVTDAEGRSHVLEYEMIETAEGWQINGVTLLPAPGAGV